MKRLPNWVQRFEAVILDHKDVVFSWQKHNCCSFTAKCFEAITGIDTMKDINQDFKTKTEAYKAMFDYCGGDVAEAANKAAGEVGLREVKTLQAKRGDPVLVNWDKQDLLATVDLSGRTVLAISPKDGLVHLPLASIVKAWSIDGTKRN